MTELAKRYGGSLYELAAEENLADELLQQLQTAVDSIQAEPQLRRRLGPRSVASRHPGAAHIPTTSPASPSPPRTI